jgi:hypothetical protein
MKSPYVPNVRPACLQWTYRLNWYFAREFGDIFIDFGEDFCMAYLMGQEL